MNHICHKVASQFPPPFARIYYTSIRSGQHCFPLTIILTLSRKWKRDKKEELVDSKTTSIPSIQTEPPPTTIFHPVTQRTLRALPRRKEKSMTSDSINQGLNALNQLFDGLDKTLREKKRQEIISILGHMAEVMRKKGTSKQ